MLRWPGGGSPPLSPAVQPRSGETRSRQREGWGASTGALDVRRSRGLCTNNTSRGGRHPRGWQLRAATHAAAPPVKCLALLQNAAGKRAGGTRLSLACQPTLGLNRVPTRSHAQIQWQATAAAELLKPQRNIAAPGQQPRALTLLALGGGLNVHLAAVQLLQARESSGLFSGADAAGVSIGQCLHSSTACSAPRSSQEGSGTSWRAGKASGKSWRGRTTGQNRKGRQGRAGAHLARQLDGLGSALHLLKLHVGKAAGAASVAVVRDAHLRGNTGGLEA